MTQQHDKVIPTLGGASESWWSGDASVQLEELITQPLPPLSGGATGEGRAEAIELVGPHLRVAGTVRIGQHRRLSDFINHHEGLMALSDATVLRRNGEPTRVTAPSIWVSPTEVTLIGQRDVMPVEPPPEFRVPRVAHGLVVVTPGHTLTAEIFLIPQAQLSAFVESNYPAYIPMTEVRARSLADRRITLTYAFALLNRRHIVAATGLQPGMALPRTAI
jgi:hypothetical protein